MKEKTKGQGSIEYLMILAAVLAIAVIVVVFATTFFSGIRMDYSDTFAEEHGFDDCNSTAFDAVHPWGEVTQEEEMVCWKELSGGKILECVFPYSYFDYGKELVFDQYSCIVKA